MQWDEAMNITEIFKTMEYGPAPESDSAAQAWLGKHNRRFGHFINGEFTQPNSGEYFESRAPATAEVLSEIAQGDQVDVDLAVSSARTAQTSWESLGGMGRSRYLYSIARLVQKHSRLLAVLESMDNGKPIRESRDIDIPLVARHFYYHAGAAQLMDEQVPGYKAVGVAGQVIPWNFPLLMLAWKIAPALAMGNTVVLKPAEYTSITALLFAEICQEAGLPKGVVNIITGDGRTGSMIVDHSDIDKIAFTGSSRVGRIIREATAGSGKSLTLELGGKSPYIVFDDADLDSAVEGLVNAIWFNQGQVCCAGSRLLVQESISDRFYAKVRARMDKLRVGHPLDKAIDMGAIVDPKQLETITELVKRGEGEGQIYQASCPLPEEGCYYPPTLITELSPSAFLMQEEIFGPILVSTTFRTPSEAIALSNNTRYGLAASVWTENINLALDVAPKLTCGVVWINGANFFDAAAGFGGRRESGFGREGGTEGLYAYLKPDRVQLALKPISAFEANDSLSSEINTIDRTAKNYIGGKQKRPDGNYSRAVYSAKGSLIGHVGEGNRKDIRDAVEAAHKASSWANTSGHLKAQILYYWAENLSARSQEFTQRLIKVTGCSEIVASAEVEASLSALFKAAAWADKYDGAVHNVPIRGVALAMNEPMGVIGMACSSAQPLLGFISLVAPAIAMGNVCIVVPSEPYPLLATDLYQVLETSDLPGGVINIVTGQQKTLMKTLSEHDDVDSIWYFGDDGLSDQIEAAAAHTIKRTWCNQHQAYDWTQVTCREVLRHATEVKNIWVPYGEG
jgi:aldehyde dehydrogenase (NAD+)